MTPLKSTYSLPNDVPSSVFREDGFIGTVQGLNYQLYAVQHMVTCIDDDNSNGFVWHTTGSGKELTSFKASALLKENDHIHKCVFVVDCKDLDRQTREEFNKFQDGCVEEKRTDLSRQPRRSFKARCFRQDCDREISDTLRRTKSRQSSPRLAIHAKL